jgi:pullulanase
MHRLGSSIVLTSQGIPLIHAGQEFMRTKDGVENSYRASEEINRLDWDRCAALQAEVHYIKRLIELRKEHSAFRLKNTESIRRYLYFEEVPELSVGYTLRNHAGGDSAKHLYVVYNANRHEITLSISDLGDWEIIFGQEEVRQFKGNQLTVIGIGMVVLAVKT